MAKRKRPTYYAVRAGRRPGVYRSWEECEKQVSGFSNARFKGFDSHEDALAFVGDAVSSDEIETPEVAQDPIHDGNSRSSENSPDAISIKVEDASALMPPPASQSYFDQFTNFTPNATASFEDEFSRLASSQGFVSGSQEFRRERTRAIRDELKYHYSSQPNDTSETTEAIPKLGKDGLTDPEKLVIYQSMCREIGIDERDTIRECKRELKKVLVNIVDYIDARRIPGKKIEVWDWDDFDAFSEYSLQDNKRIDREVAKADGGFLSALLQNLVCPGRNRRRGGRLATAVIDKSTTRKRSEEGNVHPSKRARPSTA